MPSKMPTAARPPLKVPVRSLIAPTIIGPAPASPIVVTNAIPAGAAELDGRRMTTEHQRHNPYRARDGHAVEISAFGISRVRFSRAGPVISTHDLYLTDRPASAKWLCAEEKSTVATLLEREPRPRSLPASPGAGTASADQQSPASRPFP
jgi:hypothetical protein